MPKPALHPVPHHRAAYPAAHHEPYFRDPQRRSIDRVGLGHVHNETATPHPAAPLHRRREVLATGQTGDRGKQRDGFPNSYAQADNSVRPLRRRAAMMARPARVRIRNRNPWVLARRRLFGWNVRLPLLTAVVLPVLGSHCGVAALGTAQ
jgi:hypothetical protein